MFGRLQIKATQVLREEIEEEISENWFCGLCVRSFKKTIFGTLKT